MSTQNSLLPEDQLILAVVKLHPSGSELLKLNALIAQVEDWDYLITTIIARGIGPLFYKKLPLLTNSTLIPAEISTKLQQVYYKTFSRSMVLYEHFRKVSTAFNIHQIPVIALKGIYLSEWLYQDIGLRQFSDIDLLVKEEDGARCIAMLEELGYVASKSQFSSIVSTQLAKNAVHYPPMIKDGVSIEVHIRLHRKTESYHIIIPTVWSNASPAIVNTVPVLVLNDVDLLFHLCLHLDKHFKIGHVQFTCFTDISNLLEKEADVMDWEKLSEVCRLYRCEEIVFQYIVLVNRYIQVTVPQDILDKYSYLLTQKEEILFIKYLKGYDGTNSAATKSGHFKYIKNLAGVSEKVRYLGAVLFPSKEFMIRAYKIKEPKWVLFYYPFRYYLGIKGVVNSLSKKSKK
jgi:hypothetical protein